MYTARAYFDWGKSLDKEASALTGAKESDTRQDSIAKFGQCRVQVILAAARVPVPVPVPVCVCGAGGVALCVCLCCALCLLRHRCCVLRCAE